MANRVALSFNTSLALVENFASGDNLDLQSGKVVNLSAGTTNGDSLVFGQSGASLAGLSLSAALNLNSQLISNVADPISAQDAATKNYVDGRISGLTWKSPVLLVATSNILLSGEQTIDGVLTSNSRVLLTAQSSATQNGLWVTSSGAWSRPIDFAVGSHAANTAVFVEEGSANSDTGWICTTDPPNDLVNTNSLTFTEFATPSLVTASHGLQKVGNDIQVNPGNGINFDGGNAHTQVALDATAPGLQFTGASPNGKLAVLADPNGGLSVGVAGVAVVPVPTGGLSVGASGLAVVAASNGGLSVGASGVSVVAATTGGLSVGASGVSAVAAPNAGISVGASGISTVVNANGGLSVGVSGLAVSPDTTTSGNPTVAVGTNGLRVIGLPLQFKVNGVSTSTAVTAANLGTLTAGATSDATSLHEHTAAPRFQTVTISALVAGDPVFWSATNDQVDKARADTDSSSYVCGLNDNNSVSSLGTGNFINAGKNPGVLSGATAGTQYYLQPTGGIGTTVPATGNIVQVGFAMNASDLWVQIQRFGKRS